MAKPKSNEPSQPSKEPQELPRLERIPIARIKVIGRRRDVDPRKIERLAASMANIGLRTPITATRIGEGLALKFHLGPGWWRLKAAERLGWDHIDAFVSEGTAADDRMRERMENLYRADLSALERAEELAALLQIVRENLQEAQDAPPGGQQPHDRGIKKAATALGFNRDELRRSLSIAGISDKAKTRAKELGLDHNQSALLEISKANGSEAQLAAIEKISGKPPGLEAGKRGKSNNKEILEDPTVEASDHEEIAEADSPPLAPDDSDEVSDTRSQSVEESEAANEDPDNNRLFAKLKTAWRNAPTSVRRRFIKKVLRLDVNEISDDVWAA